jgi:hypothetical protein
MNLPSAFLMCPQHTAAPVDRRWRRILDLADLGERATHRWDDAWVRRGLDYLTRLRACRDDLQSQRLREKAPDLAGAYELHQGDKVTRGALEGRILARQSPDVAAAACGLGRDVVDAYLALFFDVLGKLHAQSYVLIHAVGGDLWGGGLREDDTDVLLRLYGFLLGTIFLEALHRYFRGGWSIPESLEAATSEELRNLSLMILMKAVVAARVLPFARANRALRLLELSEELRQYADSLPDAQGTLEGLATLTPALPLSRETAGPSSGAADKESNAGAEASDWWAAWKAAALAA